jgi:riboflavin synthase
MFTGIVQELGKIREKIPVGKAIRFSFEAPLLSPRLQVGDSIACDGVCLTVEESSATGFSVSAVPETLAKTTLKEWKAGTSVNLEPSATPQTSLGGHFVLGHVDGLCEVVAAKRLDAGEGLELTVRLPEEFLPYCVYKGSLTLSGISLTIAAVEGDRLRFAIIPHTLEVTNLRQVTPGQHLNFEADILAKYVERQLAFRAAGAAASSTLAAATLEKWGYEVP